MTVRWSLGAGLRRGMISGPVLNRPDMAARAPNRRSLRGLAETPVAVDTTHRFFAAPEGEPVSSASTQDRLLHRTARTP